MAETTSGIGQGLAQVLDNSRSYEEFIKGRDNALKLAMAQKEQQDAKKNKLFSGIGKTLEAETWFRDAPYFQQEAQNIKKFAEDNLDKLLNNDPQTTLELETMMGNYFTAAKDSKDAREVFESMAAKLEADAEGNFDKEASYKNLQSIARGTPGDYDFIGKQILVGADKEIDLFEDYRTQVMPILRNQATTDTSFSIDEETGGIIHNTVKGTPSESVELTLRSRANNPEIFKQISKEFSELPQSVQIRYDDPVEWYIDEFTNLAPGRSVSNRLTNPDRGKGGVNFNFGSAKNDKFRFSFKTDEWKKSSAPQPIEGKWRVPPDQVGQTKVVDINTLSKSGEIGALELPINGKEVKGTVTEIYQEPGRKWMVKFKLAEPLGEQYPAGQVIELNYDSVKQDIVGKYGEDIPSLWEEHQRLFGGDTNRSIKAGAYDPNDPDPLNVLND